LQPKFKIKMTLKREQQLIQRGIDPDLYEMSGSMKQYRIDIKKLIETMTAMGVGKQIQKRVRRPAKSKTKKAEVKKK
jgi:hypothetical protein